jgi:protein-disulfide isomerase
VRTLLAAASALALSACGDREEPLPWKTVDVAFFVGDAVMGNPSAPVEIVEYASTTCGHCYAFHKQELPKLKARYIDTGKARLRWIVMPTPPAEISLAGASIARCAGEAKYFDVIADLFDSQDALIKAAPHPRRLQQQLVALGGRHGLSSDEVNSCIASPAVLDATAHGIDDAPPSVTGTPTFLIDGEQIKEHTAEAIAAAVDAKLAAPQ